jgi:5-hydroxyisourate hydrolase-like protein (transthyretin family)
VHNYPTDLIKKFYIVLFLRARIVVYSIMVVVYMLKELKNKNFVFKSVKVSILLIAAFIALSAQASACHVNIGDKVWNDLDKDGIQDTGEPGLEGVNVVLYKYNYQTDKWYQVQEKTTDEDGIYSFSVDRWYYYYVKFELIEGYEFSPKDQGDYWYDSDADMTTGNTDCIYANCNKDTVDAGMYRQPSPEPASVGNYVWNDLNVNGIQDDGEDGMEGITVKLYDCSSNELVETTTTNSNGHYEFTDLDAGSYYIVFESTSGYVFTIDGQGSEDEDSDAEAGGATSCFTLNAGDYYDTVDAGLHRTDQEIPEFPTVAIPMVAIMGLAFVFGRRKE